MDFYNRSLEFFVENNISLNEGLIKKLKDFSAKRKEEKRIAQQKREEEQRKKAEVAAKARWEKLKKWCEEPYFISDMAGDFRYIISSLRALKVPEQVVVKKLVNSKGLYYGDVIDDLGGSDYEYDERVLKLLDKDHYAAEFTDDDDNIAFVSPVNHKLYNFFGDDVAEIHLYQDYGDDYRMYEKEFGGSDSIVQKRQQLGI